MTTALAIYSALAEIANEARSDDFTATRQRVADYAGVTDRTLDRYARELERLGLRLAERSRSASRMRRASPALGQRSRFGYNAAHVETLARDVDLWYRVLVRDRELPARPRQSSRSGASKARRGAGRDRAIDARSE